MGKNYDDALSFILDGAAESHSDGRCTALLPSVRLRKLWEAWETRVSDALIFWGRGHGLEDQMAEVVQNELYAFDVYATLEGWGVGIDDGRWDKYLDKGEPATRARRTKRLRENLEMHLKRWLQKASHALSYAVDDEAMSQCDDESADKGDPDMLNGLGESVAINIYKIQNKNQAAAALRKLGYAKSFMQMTRNATTYSLGGQAPRGGLSITLGVGHFLITGNKRWDFGSMMMMVGNLREGAEVRLRELVERLAHMDILQAGIEVTPLQLAVAIAIGEHMERSGVVN